jgi:hypothetical protein
MSRTILDTRQVESREALDNIGTDANADLKEVVQAIDESGSQLRVKPESPISNRVLITKADIDKALGYSSNLSLKGKIVKFDGAVIDFDSGEVFEEDGTTSYLAGANDFTPTVLNADEYLYYAISISAGSTNADNTINLEIEVSPAASANLDLSLAPKASFVIGSAPLSLVYVQENDTNSGILDIDWENISQVSAGGGSLSTNSA